MFNGSLRRGIAAVAAAVLMLSGCGKSEDSVSSSAAESKTTNGTAAVVTLPPKDSETPDDTSSEVNVGKSDTDPADIPDLDTSDLPYTPAAWKVTSPSGNTMYMTGVMHALKQECVPPPEKITEMLSNADTLAVECDITDNTKMTSALLSMSDKINYPNGETIEEHLGEELWAEVSSYIESYGVDPETFSNMQAWYVYSSLENFGLSDIGLDAKYGFDRQLLEMAKEQGKEIYEVESAEWQLDLLASYEEDVINAAIKGYSAENKPNILEALLDMYKAFKTGDVDKISDDELDESLYSEEELEAVKTFNKRLLTDRNADMAKKAMELIDSGKNVLYAVGIAHYLGDDGIIALLTEQGCTVERIEY